jgi:hypothetical protein
MPYISYEEFDRQQTVSRLINSTFEEHQELEKLNIIPHTGNQASGLTKFSRKNSSKGKERSEVDEMDHTKDGPFGGMNGQTGGSQDPLIEPAGSIQYAGSSTIQM